MKYVPPVLAAWMAMIAYPAVSQEHLNPSNPVERQAFFGELHLHTAFSSDAYGVFGTLTYPDDAYRYARGERIQYFTDDRNGHPKSDPPEIGQTGVSIQKSDPLDFMAVTDHSEQLGVLNQPNLSPDVAKRTAWQRVIDAANANYRPGKFTTFIAYEWSSGPRTQDGRYINLHRNVIFRGGQAPLPFSAADSSRPEDLWTYLETVRSKGYEALAIPHNSNASNGLMFDWVNSDGKPIDEAYAQRRAFNEPLVEVFQQKGASETAPQLSPTDEFANFEYISELLFGGASDPRGSYARDALGRGLIIANKIGTNPYKLGFVSATDLHGGLSESGENSSSGTPLAINPEANELIPSAKELRGRFTPRVPGKVMPLATDSIFWNGTMIWGSGGLTGVWAEFNTRDSIYEAFRRKETFGTSGTRIRLRFFGGWKFDAGFLGKPDWVEMAYSRGTPMGGDLPARPADAGAPQFALWAVKDPRSANLDRIQIIKLWLDGDSYKEKIFDVAWSDVRAPDPKTGKVPAVGNTVDLKTAIYQNTIGATELSALWKDPEFDPVKPAVYYARVLEIPTPRWTTILAVRRNIPLPRDMPATLQERAVSSAIWYTPPKK